MKAPTLEMPINANERFLHAVAIRLDVIIEQNNSIIEVLSKQLDVPTTNHTSEIMTLEKEEIPVIQEMKSTRKKKERKG